MKSQIKFLLLLTVFLIPLIGAYGNFGYEQIKVLFFLSLITLSGLLWMGKGFKWSGTSKLGGIFILVLFITALSGFDPKTSILGSQPYFQGVVLYAYLFLFFLMVSSSKIKLELWAKVLAGSAIFVGLLAVKDWVLLNIFHQQIPTYAGRVVSTFGQPNFHAGFILLSLPFFYFLLKRNTNWWIVLGFLISILAIILSESRITFLLLSIILLVFLTWELHRKRIIFVIWAVILFLLTIFAIFFGAGFFEKEFKEPFKTENPDLTKVGVERRYYFWPILWELILQRPILGYGLENIQPVFSQYFETNKHILFEANLKVKPYFFGLKDLYLDRSHNYILDLLLFSGVLGLVTWVVLVVLLIKKARGVLLVGLLTYLIWIQFQNQSVVHLIFFWLLAGIIDKKEG